MAIEYSTMYGSPNNLDDLFERGTGVGANTGFYSAVLAQDLGAIYAARSLGADIGFNTNFIALNGNDLRNIFCKKGTVVVNNWVGTVLFADPGAGQAGFYYTSSGNNYWGTRTTISGSPIPYGLNHDSANNDTSLQYAAEIPGAPATVHFNVNGVNVQLPRVGTGLYRVAGDVFNIRGLIGITLNASSSP